MGAVNDDCDVFYEIEEEREVLRCDDWGDNWNNTYNYTNTENFNNTEIVNNTILESTGFVNFDFNEQMKKIREDVIKMQNSDFFNPDTSNEYNYYDDKSSQNYDESTIIMLIFSFLGFVIFFILGCYKMR